MGSLISNLLFLNLFLAGYLSGCSKKGSIDTSPTATITGVSQNRAKTASQYSFTVSLNQATAKTVTIHYTTAAGTASPNTDFIPSTGTLTIPANQQQANINITVTGDSLRKENQNFYVRLDDPQNCTLANISAIGTIINENGTYYPVDQAGYVSATSYPGYTLIWADEFNGTAIDPISWSYDVGTGNNGWGNNEMEYYTDRPQNSFVSAGNLIIEAREENYNGRKYTSARMLTKSKRVFKFARVDIRAKLPKGQGIWPALWMLGNNIDAVPWPACGEMDIMEMLGHTTNKVYGTMHWGSTIPLHAQKGTSFTLSTGSDQQFHVYSLVWKQDDIKVLVDDQEYLHVTAADVVKSPYPFNNYFFFIFNVAVGGYWPGYPDATTVFPQRMAVDYIRVFQ